MTVTLAITTSALTDTQTANGADVSTPVNELKTHFENICNGAQDVETLLLTSLVAVPTTPGSGKGKLYIYNDVLYALNDSGVATQLGTYAANDTTYILSTQVFS